MVRRPGAVWIDGVGRHAARLQRPADDEGLHRRAGLEGVGQRAVAQLPAGEIAPVAGRVARVVGQCQHLARLHVEHDHAARLGLVLDHRLAHALVGEELHLRIDRQLDVPPVRRRDAVADVLDHVAEAVLDHAARTVAPGQFVLERELDPLLSVVLDVGEAHHMRRRLAFRVLALVLAQLVHAAELEREHLVRHLLVDLPPQPGEVDAVADLCGELGRRDAERLREPGADSRVGVHVLRDRPQRRGGHAGGQDQPVAVGDAAAARRQLDRARIARLALAKKERRVDHLHVERAPEQHAEPGADDRDEELRAPRRSLRRQQRARRVRHAARAAPLGLRERTLLCLAHRAASDAAALAREYVT